MCLFSMRKVAVTIRFTNIQYGVYNIYDKYDILYFLVVDKTILNVFIVTRVILCDVYLAINFFF